MTDNHAPRAIVAIDHVPEECAVYVYVRNDGLDLDIEGDDDRSFTYETNGERNVAIRNATHYAGRLARKYRIPVGFNQV